MKLYFDLLFNGLAYKDPVSGFLYVSGSQGREESWFVSSVIDPAVSRMGVRTEEGVMVRVPRFEYLGEI